MCPVFDSNRNVCKVSPSESQCYKDASEAANRCKDSYNYNNCANYEAYKRGEYRVCR
ncbi:MAG: hypothetical protein FWH17_05125 [Oscillospiraceae bacterium]|nr:hypothetical protein [Oscillospiraceae bacterium]